MIIYGFGPLAVGEMYRRDVTDLHREFQRCAFRVLRTATEAEYLAQCAEHDVRDLNLADLTRGHFYDVAMD